MEGSDQGSTGTGTQQKSSNVQELIDLMQELKKKDNEVRQQIEEDYNNNAEKMKKKYKEMLMSVGMRNEELLDRMRKSVLRSMRKDCQEDVSKVLESEGKTMNCVETDCAHILIEERDSIVEIENTLDFEHERKRLEKQFRLKTKGKEGLEEKLRLMNKANEDLAFELEGNIFEEKIRLLTKEKEELLMERKKTQQVVLALNKRIEYLVKENRSLKKEKEQIQKENFNQLLELSALEKRSTFECLRETYDLLQEGRLGSENSTSLKEKEEVEQQTTQRALLNLKWKSLKQCLTKENEKRESQNERNCNKELNVPNKPMAFRSRQDSLQKTTIPENNDCIILKDNRNTFSMKNGVSLQETCHEQDLNNGINELQLHVIQPLGEKRGALTSLEETRKRKKDDMNDETSQQNENIVNQPAESQRPKSAEDVELLANTGIKRGPGQEEFLLSKQSFQPVVLLERLPLQGEHTTAVPPMSSCENVESFAGRMEKRRKITPSPACACCHGKTLTKRKSRGRKRKCNTPMDRV